MTIHIISISTILILFALSGKASSKDILPDVTSYYLTIEPNINEGSIKGKNK